MGSNRTTGFFDAVCDSTYSVRGLFLSDYGILEARIAIRCTRSLEREKRAQ